MDYRAAITAIARWASRNIYSSAKPALVLVAGKNGLSLEQQAARDRAIRGGVQVVEITAKDARVRHPCEGDAG